MSSSTSPFLIVREHVVTFGAPRPGALHVPLRVLGHEPAAEVWESNDDVIFGAISVAETMPLEALSREVYSTLIHEVRASGFPYFVRMWNYLGDINDLMDGRERYQLFCAGRHDAFVAAGYHHDVDLPAASAVGMHVPGLITYFLAAREPGVQVENPRQVAAYNYPPRYGPKSPSFSRATVWNGTVFVSGTSSVVGHETVHPGNVDAQLEETLHNIEIVLARTGRTLADVISAKTYIRRVNDYERIARRLNGLLPNNVFVEADICRADLLLEIECVGR